MTFHQKPRLGVQLNRKHRLAKGLTGCWMMNEHTGGMIFDSSVNALHGVNDGADWVPDGLNFSGAERVELDKVPIGDSDAFTVSARINGAAGGTIYAEGYTVNASWTILFQIDDGAPYSARIYIKENNVWKALTAGTTAVNDGWHTVTVSQKNKSYRTIYIDGVPEATNTETVGDMSILDTANIGVLERTDLAAHYVGDIAYMHMHNRGFTDADAKEYNRDPHGMFKPALLPQNLYSYIVLPSTDILSGKLIIKDTSIVLLDGLLRLKDKNIDTLDGKIQLKDIDTDTVDGLVKVQDIATDITDGKVQVLDVATGLTDGRLSVKDKATGVTDGKVQVQDTATNLLDGKGVIITTGQDTGHVDGKINIKDVTTEIVDGLIRVKDTVTGIVDGKLKIGTISYNLADGLIKIKDTTTGITDGKIQIKDVATGTADGLLKIKDSIKNLADGKISIAGVAAALIRRISIANKKPTYRLTPENQKPTFRLETDQPKPSFRLEPRNK